MQDKESRSTLISEAGKIARLSTWNVKCINLFSSALVERIFGVILSAFCSKRKE